MIFKNFVARVSCVLICMLACLVLADAQNSTNSLKSIAKKIDSLLTLAQNGSNYIIVFKSQTSVVEFKKHITWVENFLEKSGSVWQGRIMRKFTFAGSDCSFCAYSGTFHPKIVEAISAIKEISVIAKDDIVTLSSSAIKNQTNANWNLACLSALNCKDAQNSRVFSYASAAGEGVDIYILDTGVNIAHQEFGGRASIPSDFVAVTSEDSKKDLNGHGTHVAGIAAGSTFGTAKKARIISLKVLDKQGAGPWASIIAGLDYAVTNYKKYRRPSVVNISISGKKNDAVDKAIAETIKAGVHVIIAAGNNNDDACKYSPASSNFGLVIGSYGLSGAVSSFSNKGPCVTMYAPGEVIMSSAFSSDSGSITMSGTSMASPHAAGAVAILLSQVPAATPKIVIDFMNQISTKNDAVNRILNQYVPQIFIPYKKVVGK